MVARMQGVSPYKTGGETPPLQIIRFLPKAGAYGMPLTGFGANIRCVHPTDFESCAAGAVSLQAPPQAHAEGSFFQKAPFQSRKNLPATDTGMLGERTQMSAPAFQPHRRRISAIENGKNRKKPGCTAGFLSWISSRWHNLQKFHKHSGCPLLQKPIFPFAVCTNYASHRENSSKYHRNPGENHRFPVEYPKEL